MKTMEIQDANRSAMPLTLILSVGEDFALLETRNSKLETRSCELGDTSSNQSHQ